MEKYYKTDVADTEQLYIFVNENDFKKSLEETLISYNLTSAQNGKNIIQ